MKSAEKTIAFLQEQIEERERDLVALCAARDVLLGVNKRKPEMPKLLPAPAKAQPLPRIVVRTKSDEGKTGQKTKNLPDGVSERSSLEPDFTIGKVPLYFTPDELTIFKVLDAAEHGVCVPMEKLMKELKAAHQSRVFPVLKTLRLKLSAARCDVECDYGQGYRLAQH